MKIKKKKVFYSNEKQLYVLVWVNKKGFMPDASIDTTDWDFYKPNKNDDRYNMYIK